MWVKIPRICLVLYQTFENLEVKHTTLPKRQWINLLKKNRLNATILVRRGLSYITRQSIRADEEGRVS